MTRSMIMHIATLAAALAFSVSVAAAAELKPVEEFSSISDEAARSVALFEEMGKVLTHPRCVNCHPRGNTPLQGEAMQAHQPPVARGEADFGMPGMRCNTCHGAANMTFAAGGGSIPGNPNWHLAPAEMAWQGKSLADICALLKDESRNRMTLAKLADHNASDALVGWGWQPGEGRAPAPGTQELFGALTKAWINTGAHCPQ